MLPGLAPNVGGARFPRIVGVLPGNSGVSRVGSSSVVFPVTTVAGDLILILFACENNNSAVSSASGYTVGTVTTNGVRLQAIYKTAASGETGVTLNHGSNRTAWATYIIRNWTSIVLGTAATGTAGKPNAPSVALGSVKSALWIPYGAQPGVTVAPTAPTNYGSLATDITTSVGTGDVRIVSAVRRRKIATEDPPVFGGGTNSDWVANTAAVY